MSRALVIGQGAAGLFASALLAEKGWQVTLAGRGAPAAAMSTGCLRSPPGNWRGTLLDILNRAGLHSAAGRRVGVSNLGTLFECALAPDICTWEEGNGPKGLSVIGVEGHPSLRPCLADAMLERQGVRSEHLHLPWKVPPDVPLASRFLDEGAWEVLARSMKEAREETVLLPSLFPLSDLHRVRWLEGHSGRKVLEAITPLGIPGQRFLEVLAGHAMKAGVSMRPGTRLVSLEMEGDRFRGAVLAGGLETRRLEADTLLLATGGALPDGMAISGRGLADPLTTFQVSTAGGPLQGGYAHRGHHLLLPSGREAANVFGAGDCLARSDRGYGGGLSEALNDAWAAVQAMEGP